MGTAVANGMFKLVDNLASDIVSEPFETDGGPGNIPAESFQAISLVGLAGDSHIEGESIPIGSLWFCGQWRVSF